MPGGSLAVAVGGFRVARAEAAPIAVARVDASVGAAVEVVGLE